MIWLDLDGVMADFDTHYENHFGIRPTRWPAKDGVDWAKVRTVPDFFRTLPLMPGARDLFRVADELGHGVAFLTGCPKELNASDNQKRDWTGEKFPDTVTVCCRSRDKCLHGKPGDVLVDDYLKYRHLWVGMGGIFIHHTSAAESIRQLKELYL